jgi:hypothetical protein
MHEGTVTTSLVDNADFIYAGYLIVHALAG